MSLSEMRVSLVVPVSSKDVDVPHSPRPDGRPSNVYKQQHKSSGPEVTVLQN